MICVLASIRLFGLLTATRAANATPSSCARSSVIRNGAPSFARFRPYGEVEVFWPTSRTTQVFRDVKADQAIEVTEFAKEYRKLDWTKLAVPKE